MRAKTIIIAVREQEVHLQKVPGVLVLENTSKFLHLNEVALKMGLIGCFQSFHITRLMKMDADSFIEITPEYFHQNAKYVIIVCAEHIFPLKKLSSVNNTPCGSKSFS